jgi:NAD(P)-dependent dehydrogenase (short-subunit alcohol dehydrogenase family)
VRTDVRLEEEVKELVDKTIARFGRLDVDVNNAQLKNSCGSQRSSCSRIVDERR